MTGMGAALMMAHRDNLRRYCQLLATDLTDVERDLIHRRIAETRLDLDRLERERARDADTSSDQSVSAAPASCEPHTTCAIGSSVKPV
jgi:hypothetical protein